MPSLIEQAHELVRTIVRRGDVVIDATAGNGHDTRFLAELVGSVGHVFAFDLQQVALDRTRLLLDSFDISHVTLIRSDHAELTDIVPSVHHGRVRAIMFNLGYLPGSDKSVVTRVESSLRAISDGLELLMPGGILTVLAYTGHDGGLEETEVISGYLRSLPRGEFDIDERNGAAGRGSPPRLLVVRKRLKTVAADKTETR